MSKRETIINPHKKSIQFCDNVIINIDERLPHIEIHLRIQSILVNWRIWRPAKDTNLDRILITIEIRNCDGFLVWNIGICKSYESSTSWAPSGDVSIINPERVVPFTIINCIRAIVLSKILFRWKNIVTAGAAH